MSEIAVKAERLGKCFSLNVVPNLSLIEAAERRLRRLKSYGAGIRRDLREGRWPRPGRYLHKQDHEDFWALRDISFELNHGEVLGIIGPNGAGKSTLLKILSQVLAPTEGRVELHGRVGALLEVGTGFNPELSGRENIYLYGSILGMDRADITRRFDEIVAFAEIEKFLEQPIKNYSTGMHSRLAFSVAAHLECDILLVDEVLAVGDAAFRAKCLGKMQDVTGQGRAVIYVSHNMSAINNMCDKGIVLQNGRIAYQGEAGDASEFYMEGVRSALTKREQNPVEFSLDENKPIQLRRVSIYDNNGVITNLFDRSEVIIIKYEILVRKSSLDYFASLTLRDEKGNILIHSTDEDEIQSKLSKTPPGVYIYRIELPKKLLKPGCYYVTPGIEKKIDGRIDKYENLLSFTIDRIYSESHAREVRHRQNLIAPDIPWEIERSDIEKVI